MIIMTLIERREVLPPPDPRSKRNGPEAVS
jgi:hypothetical protein